MKLGIVGNCQVFGYVNCFSALMKDGEVMGTPGTRLDDNLEALKDSDIIYAAPEFIDTVKEKLDGKVQDILALPMLFFDRYHPDMTYVRHETNGALAGVLDNYHSLICFAAFKAGRTEEEALQLYTDRVYGLLGYLSGWNDAASKFLDIFKELEIDISDAFVRWTRRRAFMHTFNHPRIECLFDIARAILKRDGISLHDLPECVVHDNLAQGVQFAVYPEIATRYGIRGSYYFKLFHKYKVIDLRELVRMSYAQYARQDMDKANVSMFRRKEYDRIMEALQNGEI